jgi:hypothetical protein
LDLNQFCFFYSFNNISIQYKFITLSNNTSSSKLFQSGAKTSMTFIFHFKKSILVTNVGLRRFLRGEIRLPASEDKRLLATEVAGIAKYF